MPAYLVAEVEITNRAGFEPYGAAVGAPTTSAAVCAAHAIESGWVQVNQGWARLPATPTAATRRAVSANSRWKTCSTASPSART